MDSQARLYTTYYALDLVNPRCPNLEGDKFHIGFFLLKKVKVYDFNVPIGQELLMYIVLLKILSNVAENVDYA